MASVRFLDFQYGLSKGVFSTNPKRLFSFSNRQYSCNFLPVFHPNPDEMRRVFDKFDSNKDGKISQEEYKAILRALGNTGSTILEVNRIFQIADLNNDGYIDFREFMDLHSNGGGVRMMDIRNAFRAFDLDKDGKISAEDVHEMLKKLGERFSLGDCRRMVGAVDVNGDGFINMDEFITMMTRSMTRF
ncbi:hypothetical protein RND81_03G010900 [Saponaria officinalis]|uniref:EF-hand domain-containing protein n=1 Tax=Saponaria officinalis TaxID=3572 RepID=A0AAW1M3D9_SAPOF